MVSCRTAADHISHGYLEPLCGCDDPRFVHFVYFPQVKRPSLSVRVTVAGLQSEIDKGKETREKEKTFKFVLK